MICQKTGSAAKIFEEATVLACYCTLLGQILYCHCHWEIKASSLLFALDNPKCRYGACGLPFSPWQALLTFICVGIDSGTRMQLIIWFYYFILARHRVSNNTKLRLLVGHESLEAEHFVKSCLYKSLRKDFMLTCSPHTWRQVIGQNPESNHFHKGRSGHLIVRQLPLVQRVKTSPVV